MAITPDSAMLRQRLVTRAMNSFISGRRLTPIEAVCHHFLRYVKLLLDMHCHSDH